MRYYLMFENNRHLCSEEDFEMLTVGQYGMLRDLAEEAVQSFLPSFNEVIIETLHHAFHHKLLWQRLRTQQKTNVRPCKTCNQKHQFI